MNGVPAALIGVSAGCQHFQQQAMERLQSLLKALPHHTTTQLTWGTAAVSGKDWASRRPACGTDSRITPGAAAAPIFLASVTLSAPIQFFGSVCDANPHSTAPNLTTQPTADASTTTGTPQYRDAAMQLHSPAPDSQLLWRSTGAAATRGGRPLPLAAVGLTPAVTGPAGPPPAAATSSAAGSCSSSSSSSRSGAAGGAAAGGCEQLPATQPGRESSPRVAQWLAGGGQAAVGAGAEDEAAERQRLADLTGTWIKDRERSDSMEPAMNLMRLNGIVRQAVKLVRGVHIAQDPEHFTFTVFSVIAWFKVKEVYPWSGEARAHRRRDLRRGKAQGYVEPQGKHVNIRLQWSDPLGGTGTDHFRLINEDELHIESVIHIAGGTATYRTVYTRKPDRQHRQQLQQQSGSSSTSSSSSSSTSSGSEAGSENGDGQHP